MRSKVRIRFPRLSPHASRLTLLQPAIPLADEYIHRPDFHPMPLRILYQLRWRVKTHRLAVEQCTGECGRLVAFEPGRDINQQCETGGMRFGKSVFAEALDLLEDLQREFFFIAIFEHAIYQAIPEWPKSAFAFPSSHGPAQLVRFANRKIGGHHGNLHDLFLENRNAQRASQYLF